MSKVTEPHAAEPGRVMLSEFAMFLHAGCGRTGCPVANPGMEVGALVLGS